SGASGTLGDGLGRAKPAPSLSLPHPRSVTDLPDAPAGPIGEKIGNFDDFFIAGSSKIFGMRIDHFNWWPAAWRIARPNGLSHAEAARLEPRARAIYARMMTGLQRDML